MHAATPAPDGKPARPAWQAVSMLVAYIGLMFCLVAVVRYAMSI